MSTPRSLSRSPHPPSANRLLGWLRQRPLARDLTVILCIKLVLLIWIKYTFFNHPQAPHMSLPPSVVAHQLLDTPVPPMPHQGDNNAR